MRKLGEIPAALGFKRKPISEIARLLDVLNGEEPGTEGETYDANDPRWRTAVEEIEEDLACIQALEYDAPDHEREMSDGAILIPRAADSLAPRWLATFDAPSSLAFSTAAKRDYVIARRALRIIASAGGARLLRRCRCGRYIFGRVNCESVNCRKFANRHEQKYAPITEQAQRLHDSASIPEATADELIEPETNDADDSLPRRSSYRR